MPKRNPIVRFLVMLLAIVPVTAEAKTLEELLVEKGVLSPSEARAAAAPRDANIYWDKGTRLDFPDSAFTLQINTLLQTRYTFTDDETAPHTSGFSVPRARLTLSGTALSKQFTYKLQSDFVGTTDDSGALTPSLKDAYIQWEPVPGGGLRLGQFRPSISRQFNTSEWLLEFPDRTKVSDTFSILRQPGAGVFYSDPEQRITVFGNLFNGESDREGGIGGETNHTGSDAMVEGEVGSRVNIRGKMDPFIEGDINFTHPTAVNAGFVYAYGSSENNIANAGLAHGSEQRLSADLNIKSNGFAANGEFFWMRLQNDALPETSRPVGFYVQIGYFFSPKLELASRYGHTDCSNGVPTGNCKNSVNRFDEAGVALDYYFWKSSIKLQLAWEYYRNIIRSKGTADSESDDDINLWLVQFSTYL